jgi:DinB superfamily
MTSMPTMPASVLAARQALATATADYLAIPDDVLERDWTWRGGDLDVRYGVYRAAETIEAATAEIDAVLTASGRPVAARRIAPSTIARWELQGRLAALDDSMLDRVAKDGEWTVRQVVAHTIDGQRSYGWFTRWWTTLPVGPERPDRVTDDVERLSESELPGEEAEGAGTLPELRARFDACLDEWAMQLGSTGEDVLALPARWSNTPVSIDHRLGRWASHIAEHTIQLDKTLDWLGHRPREVELIVREAHAAWGRLESRLFPSTSTPLEVDAILARVATMLVTEARSTRAAAEA